MESKEFNISRQREYVKSAYDTAAKRFDVTDEYIYENQKEDALNIVNLFYNHGRYVVAIQKKTKVGADGLMIEIAKLLTTHPDDSFIINVKNVRIITGMSNVSWETDMIKKAPEWLQDKIFHHGKLPKSNLPNMTNGLVIIDEFDSGNKERQVLHKTLRAAGLLDVDYMTKNNIRFVFISATMLHELHEFKRWEQCAIIEKHYKMIIPPSYIGISDFLDRGIIQEFYALNTRESAQRWIKEDILDNYRNDYRIHIVRVNDTAQAKIRGTNRTSSQRQRTRPITRSSTDIPTKLIQDACQAKNVEFRNHNSIERLTDDELNKFFTEPLTKHIVIAVKGFFRRANLIPNCWKLHIGAIHELFTKKVDYTVQVQGLPGRMTGYWRKEIDSGHKTGPYRTSKEAVEQYEKNYQDPFGHHKYQQSGFNKEENGSVNSSRTVFSPENVDGVNPVDSSSEEPESNYEITELYDDRFKLKEYCKTILNGDVSIYGIYKSIEEYGDISIETDCIIVRGRKRPILTYKSKSDFKNQDINLGIGNKISARIMPVKVQPSDNIKWIGIYKKTELKPIELAKNEI